MNAIDRAKLLTWLETEQNRYRKMGDYEGRTGGFVDAFAYLSEDITLGDFDLPDAAVVTREQMRKICGSTSFGCRSCCNDCPYAGREAKRDE